LFYPKTRHDLPRGLPNSQASFFGGYRSCRRVSIRAGPSVGAMLSEQSCARAEAAPAPWPLDGAVRHRRESADRAERTLPGCEYSGGRQLLARVGEQYSTVHQVRGRLDPLADTTNPGGMSVEAGRDVRALTAPARSARRPSLYRRIGASGATRSERAEARVVIASTIKLPA
jgi:hypothetical protein